MLTFLNPAVLFALAAALVPILIHFLNVQRRKKLPFGSLMLIEELERNALKKFKLNQWLLLVLRSLAVFFIVLAFSKPLFSNATFGALGSSPKMSVGIVFDNSYSMQRQLSDGRQGFVKAKQLVIDLLDNLSSGDEVFLSFTSDPPSGLVALTPKEAIKTLSRQDLKPARAPVSLLLKESLETLSGARHFHRECYVISDFQHHMLSTPDSGLWQIKPPEVTRLVFFRASPAPLNNAAILEASVLSQIFEPQRPVRLQAEVDFFSQSPKHQQRLKLFLNERFRQEAGVNNTKSSRAKALISAQPNQTGFISGKVELDKDAYAFDNNYWFVVNIPDKLNITIASDNPREAAFLKAALKSYPNPDYITIRSIRSAELSTAELSNTDVLMLVGPDNCNKTLSAQLLRYVNRGGGLIWFLTTNPPNPGQLNACLKELGLGKIKNQTKNAGSATWLLNEPDWRHEFFRDIAKNRKIAKSQWIRNQSQVKQMAMYDQSQTENILLRVLNNQPVVTLKHATNGRIMVWTTLPVLSHTDLMLNPLFSPLIFQSMVWAASSKSNTGKTIFAGQPLTLELSPVKALPAGLELRKPSGQKTLPAIQTQSNGIFLKATAEEIDEPGIYSLQDPATESELFRFAVNVPESETDTTLAGDSTLSALATQLLLSPGSVSHLSLSQPQDEIEAWLDEGRTGYGMWKLFVGLALGCLVLESLLARKISA